MKNFLWYLATAMLLITIYFSVVIRGFHKAREDFIFYKTQEVELFNVTLDVVRCYGQDSAVYNNMVDSYILTRNNRIDKHREMEFSHDLMIFDFIKDEYKMPKIEYNLGE